MPELAHHYLGNYFQTAQLQQQVDCARADGKCLEVNLSQDDCAKSRIYTKTSSALEIGIIKERDRSLSTGDVFETESHHLLFIHIAAQQLIVLSLPEGHCKTPLALLYLGHTLGNHHYPILVTKDKLYIQLGHNREVIETTVRNFNIPDLEICYETRSSEQALKFATHRHLDHVH